MENAGSAIVDFGRFLTGWLVVGGVGMLGSFFFLFCFGSLGVFGGGGEVRSMG